MLRAEDVLGTWTLVSFVIEFEDGTSEMPYGPHPSGTLHYAPDGQMLVHLADPAPDGTPRLPFPKFIFYAARYRIEGDSVVHDVTVSALQPPAGARLVRSVALDGDGLHLIAPPATSLTAKPGRARLLWQRVPAAGGAEAA